MALGSIAGLFIVYFGSDRISNSMANKHGVKSAEYRLVLYCWFQYLLPIGLLIYGWSSYYKWHWSIPILGTFIFGFGCAILFVRSLSISTDHSPRCKIISSVIVTLAVTNCRSFYYICCIGFGRRSIPSKCCCNFPSSRRTNFELWSRTWMVISP